MKTKMHLYYLDDDNDDLEIFTEIAESLGQKVTGFSNGHELIQALRFTKDKPDIVFLDLHMPVLNGEEILHILRHSSTCKDIPIVMISSVYPKKLVTYLLSNGADYLMKKCPSCKDLKQSLEEVLKVDWKDFKHSA